jgi:hypothetical protein
MKRLKEKIIKSSFDFEIRKKIQTLNSFKVHSIVFSRTHDERYELIIDRVLYNVDDI